MKVLYVPGRQQGKSIAMLTLTRAHLAAGHTVVVELGSRAFTLPNRYLLERATSQAVTMRTPEGMLVTYKPKRGTP